MKTTKLTTLLLGSFLLAATVTMSLAAAQRVSNLELQLQEALHKQQVEGDLPGAIKIYQQIISTRSGSRTVIARALLELAGCYEKLGQQSETVYQQIVRDFSDQPAATQARARLAALRPPAPPATMTLRKIELGEGISNVIATDGQRAVYWNATNTALIFGDIAGKQKRTILETTGGPRPFVSRDLSMVLLFFPVSAGPEKLAVVKTDGTGYREFQLNENGVPILVGGLGPPCAAWSWDNRHVVLCQPATTGDRLGGRLLKFAIADGQVTDITPTGPVLGGNIIRVEISPDGQYIAIGAFSSPVFVMPSQGGVAQTIAAEGVLADWSRDGRYVLVGEANRASLALVAVRVTAGKPTGERVSLKSVTGTQARTMANGTVVVLPGPRGRELQAGKVSADEKSIAWTALDIVGNPQAISFAAWSPDAGKFAYVSAELPSIMRAVRIKDLANQDDFELYRAERILGCIWANLRPIIYCTRALEGNTEIVSISVETRRSEVIGSLAGAFPMEHITPDDRALVLIRGVDWIAWEIETGRQTTIPFFRSADGRWSLSIAREGRPAMIIRGPGDTDWRPLVARRMPSPTGATAIPIRFSPDGRWVIYHDRDVDGGNGLYRISTAPGGEPERLGDYPTDALSSVLSVSPDARQFIVNSQQRRQPELWALENFLPAAAGGPQAGAK